MKFAIYKNKKIGHYISKLVFEAEDFENKNEYIPPYVKPRFKDGKIQPIEINSVGGYCSHDPYEPMDSAIEFIEYRDVDSPYDEPLKFDEKVSLNNPNFDCGWISPEGDTYYCEPRCHSECASKISEHFYDNYHGERILEENGWVKVYHDSEIDDSISVFAPEGLFFYDFVPTERQISVIKRLGRFNEEVKHFIRTRNDRNVRSN